MIAEPAARDLGQPTSSFEGLSSMLPVTIEEAKESEADQPSPDAVAAVQETTTKKPTVDDLLESAKRRKRRSVGPLPSPLASNPPSPVEQQPGSTLISTSTPASAHTLAKAFDDFELDVRKSIGRASLLLNDFVLGPKSSATFEDEKAEAFVKGLITSHHGKRKTKRRAGGEEERGDNQSSSD